MRTYIGKSNYNGLIATLRKRTSHGLTAQVSYTFSHTLDQNISNQNQGNLLEQLLPERGLRAVAVRSHTYFQRLFPV
jgi:hypothetical protein